MQEIEERCNSEIRAARAVRPHVVHEHDDSQLLRSKTLRGQLPSWDKVQGQLRLLEIEGVDVNACGGTHLHTTAQIQVGWQPFTSVSPGSNAVHHIICERASPA